MSYQRHTALLLASFATVIASAAKCEEPTPSRRVMTWVPPYAIEESRGRIEESFDGVKMSEGLTHLGLQFWNPTAEGTLHRVSRFGVIEDEAIDEFREWGQQHEVKILLCVYNGTLSGWDWALATSAFSDNRERFIDSLVHETQRLQLDGIDIDLEGNGELDYAKESFVRFIQDLSKRLREEDLELTLDTFAYRWHAPNQTWWRELLPHVDAIHVMGYAETGAYASEWRNYAFLQSAVGDHTSKLVIGMPGTESEWQNQSLSDHLQWVLDDPFSGVAIWDAQLKDPAWRAKSVWRSLAKLKGNISTKARVK